MERPNQGPTCRQHPEKPGIPDANEQSTKPRKRKADGELSVNDDQAGSFSSSEDSEETDEERE